MAVLIINDCGYPLWLRTAQGYLVRKKFARKLSNIFRDSESLGKSNGKKWSQI